MVEEFSFFEDNLTPLSQEIRWGADKTSAVVEGLRSCGKELKRPQVIAETIY